VGIAGNKAAIMAHANPDQFVKDKIESFWRQPQVADMSASGLRGTVRLQPTIPLGAQWFNSFRTCTDGCDLATNGYENRRLPHSTRNPSRSGLNG
jgi:hypothetical protein